MTKADFTYLDGHVIAFSLKGHSGFADFGGDIVCAAASSAAYMTANTVTDVYGIKADVALDERKGILALSMTREDAAKCKELLDGFALHVKSLSKQYPDNIQVSTTTL